MRAFALGPVAALWAASSLAASPLSPLSGQFHSAELPNYDASGRGQATVAAGTRALAQASRSRFGYQSQHDAHLGTTFLWADAAQRRASLLAGAKPADASQARAHLSRNAQALGLSAQAIAEARLHETQQTELGAVVHRFRQQQGGLEVFGRQLNVLSNAAGQLVAVSGYFAPANQGQAAAPSFKLSAAKALGQAFSDMGGSADTAFSPGTSRNGYQHFKPGAHGGELQLHGAARAKKVLFPLDGRLLPAYYVELAAHSRDAGRQADFGYVISAADGQVLFRKNQVDHEANAFTYRVLGDKKSAHPYDSPMGNAAMPFRQANPGDPDPRVMAPSRLTQVVSTQGGPQQDPWLTAGATTTSGNNVISYLDLGGADGFDAGIDLMPTVTAPGVFDYPVSGDADPGTPGARNAAAVNLFYLNNWLHDFWYPRGFNESAGNAQQSNYGRGGVEGDPIHAEGQDFSGRNNANMSTPSDGASPRMQMYLWDGLPDASLDITAPAELAGPVVFSTAGFGPQAFEVTQTVVAYQDGTAPAGDACSAAVNGAALSGHLALIDRGTCAFTVKVKNAQKAGAVGVVMVNNVAGSPIAMGGTDDSITIPAMMVSLDDGNRIKSATSTVSMHLRRAAVQDLDGTIDAGIVAHEFFHYVSNRLVGDAMGLFNNQGRSMGEGWSDFSAMLLQVRPSDAQAPNNTQWEGAYSMGGYLLGSNYFGIRRAPYSIDLAKNPLTFKHIQNGVALPDTAPLAFGQDGSNNAEVHNSGEIWANVLWEAYAGFLKDGRYGMAQARKRVQNYVIAGLKMTPNAPTMLEARDAILAVADASDDADFTLWATAFAKRGMGLGAVGPDRNSNTHIGVTESYVVAAPTP
jgi:hypothetical protein